MSHITAFDESAFPSLRRGRSLRNLAFGSALPNPGLPLRKRCQNSRNLAIQKSFDLPRPALTTRYAAYVGGINSELLGHATVETSCQRNNSDVGPFHRQSSSTKRSFVLLHCVTSNDDTVGLLISHDCSSQLPRVRALSICRFVKRVQIGRIDWDSDNPRR